MVAADRWIISDGDGREALIVHEEGSLVWQWQRPGAFEHKSFVGSLEDAMEFIMDDLEAVK